MSAQVKNRGLGRGLGALLPSNNGETEIVVSPEKKMAYATNQMNEIPVGKIEVNPYQPRTYFDPEALAELSESIKTQGIIQPITVRKNGEVYQLISGERRLQASKLAGLTTIPAYIRTADDQQMLEMALIENIQRENLNAIEIALSYQRLMQECDLKQEDLGERVGKSRATVNNYMRLLKLPTDIQIGLRDEQISMGHARAIITVESEELQLAIFHRTVAEGWSVRRVEQAVKELAEAKTTSGSKEKTKETNTFNAISEKLTELFGSKVIVAANKQGKGEIKVPFESEDELTKIIALFKL